MPIINSATEVYAILGDPISHSLSPVIMNNSFKRLNMDKVFLAFRCNLNEADMIINSLKKIDLKGYVFTMPLKEIAVRYLDELKDEAAITGAVNCVKNTNGYLIGYNTDSLGFWTAVQEKKSNNTLNKLFIFGMGGFSKAAVTQAAIKGVKEIIVTNYFSDVKFVNSFKLFLERLYDKTPNIDVKLLPWKPEVWKAELRTSDIIANATPNGLRGEGNLQQLISYKDVKEDAIFFDAIYEPLKTQFLKVAEGRGHKTVGGLDLLAHQGVCSFGIWTGQKVEPKVMKEDALKFLQGKR